MSFANRVTSYQQRVNRVMDEWLPNERSNPQTLHAAMRYAVLGEGKRVRPLLSYATAETLGLSADQADAISAAVEMVHGYSLVHDDLPAMDDDDLRRGQPTCHIKFDEATAILAGDALQAFAFEILAADGQLTCTAVQRIRLLKLLATASGSLGMAGGQALDLAATGQTLSEDQLREMHGKKTGALIAASVIMVAALADLTSDEKHALATYARAIGLAFQVQDDVLDITSDTATLGKPQGSDLEANKATYPAVMGIEAAQQLAENLREQAVTPLEVFGERAEPLHYLANLIVSRQH